MGTETAQAAAPVSGTASRLHLASRMAAQHASPLLENLQALKGQDVDLDASGVATVSTPCLQVLLAAGVGWRRDGHRLRIIGPSTDFLMALEHMGISLEAIQSRENAKCP